MKLELKHLAPYLPYGLRLQINVFDQALVDGIMVGVNSKEIEFSEIRKTITDSFVYDLCIPILLPLSDINDGEENTVESISKCCYSYVQYLISNHFDVFGLIEKGLAIDKNTLSH